MKFKKNKNRALARLAAMRHAKACKRLDGPPQISPIVENL